jgi:hypothetical protein
MPVPLPSARSVLSARLLSPHPRDLPDLRPHLEANP